MYVNVRKLVQLMSERGLNQRELANEADIGLNTISRILNRNEYAPGIDVMLKIAKVLDVSVYDLINDWRV